MLKTTETSILTCNDLAVGYKNKAVLKGLNIRFEPGHFISLLGPNGAGKTTLLRTMSRHLAPINGWIEVNGRPLADMSAAEMARFMAVVLTEKLSPPLFTVYEFVALGRYPHTDFLGRFGPVDRKVVQQAISAVRADDLSARYFSDLSDGERQKALVARALAQQPKLLLLDEPTLHLDLKHRVEVMGILRDLCRSRGITVVASLHDVDVAAKVSDRVLLVKDGAISDWGSPEQVLTSRSVANLYDFTDAEFNHHLGSIEMRANGGRERIFVVGGMGSGAQIYRMLAKRGYSITTGILHANDLDCYVARSLGAQCMVQKQLEAITEKSLAEAETHMNDCSAVIDCGFMVSSANHGNIELLKSALRKGIPVFSLRKVDTEAISGNGDQASLIRCENASRMIEELDQAVARKPPKNLNSPTGGEVK